MQQEEFKRVLLKDIIPDPNQPRKHFDETGMTELSHSISQHGVKQPILIRPTKTKNKGKYMIVCGERRYRATLNAAIVDIPCMIQTLTDSEALEIQITENLQRENINPMEEAEAFQSILKGSKYSIKELAARIGKKPDYVIQRVRLCDLIPEWQEVLYADKLLLSQANILCRFAPGVQKDFASNYYLPTDWKERPDGWKVRDIHIGREATNNLDDAPFKTEDPTLNPKMGACGQCRYNSLVSQLPFEGHENSRMCSNPACYKIKTENSYKLKLQEVAADEDVLLIAGYVYNQEDKAKIKLAEEMGRTVLPNGDWKVLQKPDEPEPVKSYEDFKKEYDEDNDDITNPEYLQEVKRNYEEELEEHKAELLEYAEEVKEYEENRQHAKKAFVVAGFRDEGKMIEVYVPAGTGEDGGESNAILQQIDELREKNKIAIRKDEVNLLKSLGKELRNMDKYSDNRAEPELTDWLAIFYLLYKECGWEMQKEIRTSFGEENISMVTLLSNVVAVGYTGVLFAWMRKMLVEQLCKGSFDYDDTGLATSSFLIKGIVGRHFPAKLANYQQNFTDKARERHDMMTTKIGALQQTEMEAV